MDDIDHFAEWNQEDQTVTLQPYKRMSWGLHRVSVILSDGEATNEYKLYIYVFEGVYEEDFEEGVIPEPESEEAESSSLVDED